MAIKTIGYAASDIGKHRASNQDSGYSGYQLFFVADGMGGHAGGDIASAIASQRIALTDAKYESIEEAIDSLKKGILEANAMLASTVQEHPELEGMGTTFSGLYRHGNQIITAHATVRLMSSLRIAGWSFFIAASTPITAAATTSNPTMIASSN